MANHQSYSFDHHQTQMIENVLHSIVEIERIGSSHGISIESRYMIFYPESSPRQMPL